VNHISNHSGDINVSSILTPQIQGGVCIFFNDNFEFKIHGQKRDCEGNLLAQDMTIEENKVTLINIYGPNTDSPQFYESVRNTFLEFNNEYFILGTLFLTVSSVIKLLFILNSINASLLIEI
jgi:hypothetical protein